MAFYVIKGPGDFGEYLCDLAGYKCPQWHARDSALSFGTRADAYEYLASVKVKHSDAGSYDGRVVRVVPRSERREERTRMRRALDEILYNAEGLLRGGLQHFDRKDFALAVKMTAEHGLGPRPKPASPKEEP